MRYTQMLLPTTKEMPSEAEVISHQLLVRGGFIRKLTSGMYTFLPLGFLALQRVTAIVREEMNCAGAQEILMPMVQPGDLWEESGRWKKYGPELFASATGTTATTAWGRPTRRWSRTSPAASCSPTASCRSISTDPDQVPRRDPPALRLMRGRVRHEGRLLL